MTEFSSTEGSLKFAIFFILMVEFSGHFCLFQEKHVKNVDFTIEDKEYEIKGK